MVDRTEYACCDDRLNPPTISQSVSRIELCGLGRISPKHPGDTEANRPKRVLAQPLSVNHHRTHPLLEVAGNQTLHERIYFILNLWGRIDSFIRSHAWTPSYFEDIEV
jgi:hypothetical protein